MVSFGVVKLQADLTTTVTFLGKVAPISDKFEQQRLQVIGVTREAHLTYEPPDVVMQRLVEFITQYNGTRQPSFISDNPAFDWQFINFYLHRYAGSNPFGHSARRIGDFYAGLRQSFSKTSDWKRLRKTKHDHNPVNDAMSNAEALNEMVQTFGAKLSYD